MQCKWVRPERASFLMSTVLGSQSTLQHSNPILFKSKANLVLQKVIWSGT